MVKNLAILGQTSTDTVQARSANELAEEWARYRELIDSVQAIVWRGDPQTYRFTFVSQYAKTLLGYPIQRWLDEPTFWQDHIHHEDRHWAVEFCAKATSEKRSHQFDYRMIAADNRVVWLHDVVHVIVENDQPRELVGVMFDITEKKAAEDALRKSKDELRLTIDVIPQQIWSGPADGSLDYCNQRWRDYMGLSLEELQGDGWQTMLHPDDRERVLTAWRESVATGVLYEQEERHRGADGRYRWFLCRGVPLRDSNGKVVRWYGTNTDIEDRKRTEQALVYSEQRWRAVFDNSSVGITLMDQTGRFLISNATLEKMLGYTSGKLAQMTYQELTCEEDRANCEALYAELWQGKRDRFQVEKRFCTKDRGLIWIRTNGSVVRQDGEARFAIFMVEEITEQKRLFEELQRERDRLRLLLDLNHHFVSKLEIREFFVAVAHGLRKVEGWNTATILLPEPGTNLLRGYLNVGLPLEIQEMTLAIDGSVSGQVYRSGKPAVFSFAEIPTLSPDFAKSPEYQKLVAQGGINGMYALPLINDGRTLGVLALTTQRSKESAAGDMNFLQELAKLIAAALSNALRYEEISESNERLSRQRFYIQDQIRNEFNFEEIIGASPVLRNVLHQVEVVAETDSTVLVLGETGTGKELIARAIHNLSPRHNQSFIKVDCSAIPASLMESELFGYEKGAFTGAVTQKVGRFEIADKGTIFLDEIGDVPLHLQTKLLRILQDQTFERLGSNRTRHLDVRIIAATNRDLERMVEKGEFRSDLYYRLKVFVIEIPPLRERPADIPPLVTHYVQKYARRMKRNIESIPEGAMEALVHYPWPGNVRELQHFIERAVILTHGRVLQAPLSELKRGIQRRQITLKSPQKRRTMQEIERDSILQALRESNWVVGGPNGAAAKLGLKRTTLASRMEKLGISRRNGTHD